MSGTLYLTESDFTLIEGKGSSVLINQLKGLSLILFYSTQCEHCHTVLPIFKNLPGTLTGCQFGIVNIGTNQKIIEIAKKSNTPLTYVPFILLYYNGKPFMSYDDKHDIDLLRKFVIDASKKLQAKQMFIDKNKQVQTQSSSSSMASAQTKKRSTPGYTTGHPLYGNNVCYLEDEKCYK